MNCGSLYSGADGFSLAAEALGWEVLFHSEINSYARKQLKINYPNAELTGDAGETEWSRWKNRIAILFGGEPCQPFSLAGNQLGREDPRFQWPNFRRAIEEIQPLWVVNENVEPTISNGIVDQKISDLERIGYTCWPPLLIPASALGAIHQRNRVWIVAHANGTRFQQFDFTQKPTNDREREQSKDSWTIDSLRSHSWDTDSSEVLRLANGISAGLSPNDRCGQIKCYGNAVMPQIPLALFEEIYQLTFNQ